MCVCASVCVSVPVCVCGREGELMTNEIIVTMLYILHILIIFTKLQNKIQSQANSLPKYVHLNKAERKNRYVSL